MPSIERADGTFQLLDALGRNRRKRRQRGEFLVHGVRSIDAAVRNGWPLTALVIATGRRRSRWAEGVLAAVPGATLHELAVDLFDHLADRDEPCELIAVAATRDRDVGEIDGAGPLVVLDRPAAPGNLGTLIRSADAFEAAAVVILGHAADPYDPRTVRAAVGSLFSVPVVEVAGAEALSPWLRASGRRVVGLDEGATSPLGRRTGPLALVLGNEGRGLGAAARALCDELVAIPMRGRAATSLNVAVAGSIALYEVTRGA
ncbi:MAG: RNA methyltransferase [Actinobacteria bacterium]|nr:RNA methyltransferase [Actinomycetota bacterium]